MKPIRAIFSLAVIPMVIAAAIGLSEPTRGDEIQETDEPIKLAVNEWTGQHITTWIAGELLKSMGYNVEYTTAGYYPMLQAIGQGDLTLGLEIWHGNVGEGYFEMLEEGSLEELGDLGLEALQAWFYPSHVEEMCPGLPDWKALQDCSQGFATADTYPRGRFVEYPGEWGDTFNQDRMTALGLDFELIPAGSEGALVAVINSSSQNKEPLLIMFWAPHWIHAVQDLSKVNFPPYEPICAEDPSWGINPNQTYDCGHPSERITKVSWPGLKDKWPGAYRFLQSYTLTNADQERMMKAIDQDGRDILEVVQEWISENADLWKPWIEDALNPGS